MLDQDQAKVVAHETGPAAVLAGAGSGKTRCTTERAARRLVEAGVPSDGLILLTFTNKAAAEMRERLGKRLPEGIKLPWIGTFHSLGNRLLRTHGKAIGIPRNATLMDADDANRMLDAFLASPVCGQEQALRGHPDSRGHRRPRSGPGRRGGPGGSRALCASARPSAPRTPGG